MNNCVTSFIPNKFHLAAENRSDFCTPFEEGTETETGAGAGAANVRVNCQVTSLS